MTPRQRTKVVEERADLILADQDSAEAHAAYFETQMHFRMVRVRLYSSWLWLGKATPGS